MKRLFLITTLFIMLLLSYSLNAVSMYRGGASRQGNYITKALMKVSSVKWNVKIEKGIMSSPVCDENTLYIGSNVGNFYAIDKNKGTILWKFNARQSINSSALVTDDMVYFSDYKNYLYALDKKTGKLKWEKDLFKKASFVFQPGRNGFDDYLPSPVRYKNTIITSSFDPMHPLFAFDEKTGEDKWVFSAVSGDTFYCSPAVFANIVYTGGINKGIIAVNADNGNLVWEYKMENFPIKYSAAIGDDGTVYFGTKNRDFLALNGKTGEVKWRKPVSFDTWLIGNPAIADKILFVGSSKDKKLFALDALTGESKWVFEAADWVYSSPVYAEGIVYAGSHDKNVYALDAKTGKALWKYGFDSIIYSTPLIDNGVLYVAADDGNVYALK